MLCVQQASPEVSTRVVRRQKTRHGLWEGEASMGCLSTRLNRRW